MIGRHIANKRRYFEALAYLKAHPHFQVLTDAMRLEVARLERASRKGDGVAMYRMQGEANAWDGFLDEVADAEAALRKFTTA